MNLTIVAILIIILIIGVGVVIFLLLKKTGDNGSDKMVTMLERLTGLGEQNKELRETLDRKLTETHRTTQEQYRNTQEQLGQTMKTVHGISGQSAKLISEVTEKLTKLDETNKQVVNFSEQLKNLQDILKIRNSVVFWVNTFWKKL
jgi:DNA recombination protein RmuC